MWAEDLSSVTRFVELERLFRMYECHNRLFCYLRYSNPSNVWPLALTFCHSRILADIAG